MNAMLSASRPRVAVLGAGIMGSSVALELARRGADVVLVDAADAPFSGASRWNEGKLHLGFLYAGDPSLSTARSVLPGGLAFVDRVRELTGCDPTPAISAQDDLYLVHRDSVVNADAMRSRFSELSNLVRAQPAANRYPGDPSDGRMHELTRHELAELAGAEAIVAAFRVPERSIATTWVAERYLDALRAEPRIACCMATRVDGVRAVEHGSRQRWRVDADRSIDGEFDAVVNASWAGRLRIDRSVGLVAAPGWSHRYRVSLFVRTCRPLACSSMVICTGPFGDIKNYNGRDFYLSWYPAGLLVEGHDLAPPRVPVLSGAMRQSVIADIGDALGALIPSSREILASAASIEVEGGWVFAQGRGSLADPASTLHRRDRFGLTSQGSYLSVDTGKYSTAPWLALQIAERLMPGTSARPR
jgi:glycine/D-amino acid oxidase-like deaminating enzyme